MGWRECNKMDEKLKFIARYLEGEKMAPLCREFGITRPTGYKQVGIKEMEDGIWVVSFLDYDLGYFDDKSRKVEPVEDPFGMLKV